MEMQVDLLYVEGISRVDTLYFTSLANQESYFDSKVKFTFSSSYFPVKYTDKIRVLSSEMVLSQPITNNNHYAANYLRINVESNSIGGSSFSHTYYYFIDDMEYINESLIEFTITMDTIQSYMFVGDNTKGMYVTNGIIERRFINRWKNIGTSQNPNYVLNRDYLRENISLDNMFDMYSYDIIDGNDVTKYMACIYMDTQQKDNTPEQDPTYTGTTYRAQVEKAQFQLGNKYFNTTHIYSNTRYFRMGSLKVVGAINLLHNFTDNINDHYTTLLFEPLKSSHAIDAFVSPFVPFTGITIGSTQSSTYHTYPLIIDSNYYYDKWNYDDINILVEHWYYVCGKGNVLTIDDKRKTISLTSLFNSRNTSTSVAFSSSLMPVLYDENYIEILFGSNVISTSYPLHLTTSFSLTAHYFFNAIDGTRSYYINEYDSADFTDNSISDVYKTLVVDDNILYVELINDRWSEYIANNRNRWGSLVASSATGTIGNVAQGAAKGSMMGAIKGLAESGLEFLGSAMQQVLKESNLEYSPKTPKVASTLRAIQDKSAYIWLRISKVRDYEQCAQYYHRNGFLVNEPISSGTFHSMLASVNNRYYFNVLKLSQCELYNKGSFTDGSVIKDIRSRLVNGIRLWNVENAGVVIGDFQYDNVENEYLQ